MDGTFGVDLIKNKNPNYSGFNLKFFREKGHLSYFALLEQKLGGWGGWLPKDFQKFYA